MLPPGGLPYAEKLQLSVFLPNELSLEDWYAGSMANCLAGGLHDGD